MMKRTLFFILLTLSPAEAARHRGRRGQPRQPNANRGAEQQSSPSLERVLTVEDHRFPHDQFLLATLRSGGGKASRAALVAIGRIGDPYALEDITRLLDKKDREMRRLGIFALSLMNDDTSLKVLMQNLPMQRDPEVLAALLVAVGRAGGEQTMIPLANALKDDSSGPLILEGAAHGLGLLWAGNSEKWIVPQVLLQRLARLALGPDPVGTSAAFALARYKGDVVALPVPDLMEGSMKAVTPSIRAFFLRALGRVKTPLVAQFLANLYTPVQPLEVRIEVVRALGTQNSTEAILTALRKALSDPASSVVITALESIGSISSGASALADGVDALAASASSTWVRGTALKTLAKIQPTLARTRIAPLLAQPTSPVFPYAVGALGNLANQEELVKLAELTNSPNLKAAQEALEAFGTFSEDRITPPMKVELKKALERGDTALASLVAQLVEKLKWKDFAPSLATVYRLLSQPDQLEGKVAVLNALAVVGTADYTELLDLAMNDPDRQVVAAAANAYKAITGKDMSARVPLNSRVNAPAVRMSEVNAALRSEVVLKTTRGEIVLQMNEVAPLNATNFVKLVRRGFYDGKPFHRVVPDFVTQGGDPRGDGYGGPGYFVRDEVSWLKHERGTVGIATSGKDTGGCQFFFNLAPNLHLDGRYTLFAKIVRGLDVADALEVGDKIITARVR